MKILRGIRDTLIVLALLLALLFTAVACTQDPAEGDPTDGDTTATTEPDALVEEEYVDPDDDDKTPSADAPAGATDPEDPTVVISLAGTSYSVSRSGRVSAAGNVLTIQKPGTYRLTGTLDNGQIRVLVEKTERVDLILDGVSITNRSGAPLYVESADKASVTLAANSENVLTDASVYVFPEGEDKPNACLYSSEDLTIKGEGSLTVNAAYNNGIGSKNDLKILSGTITVNAVNNALKGNQSVKIEGGKLTLTGSDGIKSDSITEGEGIILISGGTVNITAGDDGLQAVTDVTVSAGAVVTVKAADNDVNCDGTTNIATGTLISK